MLHQRLIFYKRYCCAMIYDTGLGKPRYKSIGDTS